MAEPLVIHLHSGWAWLMNSNGSRTKPQTARFLISSYFLVMV